MVATREDRTTCNKTVGVLWGIRRFEGFIKLISVL